MPSFAIAALVVVGEAMGAHARTAAALGLDHGSRERRTAGGNSSTLNAQQARRVSNYRFFAPGGFGFLFSQLAVGFRNHLKRVSQVLASFIQSLALCVDPLYFLHPSSPPIIHLLISSSQLHICIFIAFGSSVQLRKSHNLAPSLTADRDG